MVKLAVLLLTLPFTISLTGCVNNQGAKKTGSQACAPLYTSNGSVKTSGCADNPLDNETSTDIEKNKETINTAISFVQTGRYTVVKAMPTQAQSHLLDVMITVTIPQSIYSIDASVRYLLKRSGYYMSPVPSQDQHVIQILSKPLPEIHRKIGPMRLIDALSMLATPAFELVTDPVKREITYQLKDSYKLNPGVQS